VTDNKRAADDAEQQVPANIIEAIQAYADARVDKRFLDGAVELERTIFLIRAALSARADGGKGEAVLDYRMLAYELEGVVIDVEQGGGGFDTVCMSTVKRVRDALYTAPQAECAPREAQPVGPRTTLNYDGTFDTTCAHCGGNGCFACLKSAAPTPERADADTAGAKPTCPHCGLTDIEFSRVCHNSACSGYAKEESFYRGWENTAAPASQGRADAGKDAALLEALRKIAAIENKMYGGDWDEIEEARSIASIAILAANKEPK
jgi:hypothetical protein